MGKYASVDPTLLMPGDTFRRPGFALIYTIFLGDGPVGPGMPVEQYRYVDILITDPDGTVSRSPCVPLARWKSLRIKRLGSLR